MVPLNFCFYYTAFLKGNMLVGKLVQSTDLDLDCGLPGYRQDLGDEAAKRVKTPQLDSTDLY